MTHCARGAKPYRMNDSNRFAVVAGSSAGGIEMLKRLVAKLPANFAAPIFIVQHLSPDFPSVLPQILSAAGKLLGRPSARSRRPVLRCAARSSSAD